MYKINNKKENREQKRDRSIDLHNQLPYKKTMIMKNIATSTMKKIDPSIAKESSQPQNKTKKRILSNRVANLKRKKITP